MMYSLEVSTQTIRNYEGSVSIPVAAEDFLSDPETAMAVVHGVKVDDLYASAVSLELGDEPYDPDFEKMVAQRLMIPELDEIVATWWIKAQSAKFPGLHPVHNSELEARAVGIAPHIDGPNEGPLTFSLRVDDCAAAIRRFYARRYADADVMDTDGDGAHEWYRLSTFAGSLTDEEKQALLVSSPQATGDLFIFQGSNTIHASESEYPADYGSFEPTLAIISSYVIRKIPTA